MAVVKGTSGNDFIHVSGDGHVAPDGYNDLPDATNGDDTIVPAGGNDTIFAGGGDDVINFKSNLNSGDQIDGGTGNDTVVSAETSDVNVTLNMVNVEDFKAGGAGGHYSLAATDVTAGESLTVDTRTASSSADIFVDADNDAGNFTFIGGPAASETFAGGTASNVYDIATIPTTFLGLEGNTGNDTFNIKGNLDSTDQAAIGGHGGSDTLNLSGGLSPSLNPDIPSQINNYTFAGIEQVNVYRGFNYTFTVDYNFDPIGQGTTIDGSRLGAGDVLTVNVASGHVGTLTLIGGAGNDVLTAGPQNDSVTGGRGDDRIDLSLGGNDTVNGGAGNDTIIFGATLTAGDTVNGGTGNDDLVITGNYDMVFNPTTIQNIDIVTLGAGYDYTLSAVDSFVAAGHTLTVDGSGLGAADTLTYDGSSETDGHLVLLGGAGADVLTGGAKSDSFDGGDGNDTINLQAGGNDTADGGAGNDVFNMGAAFTAGDRIDGGSGNDTINLDGNYSTELVLNGASFTNVETLHFGAGFDYVVKISAGNVGAGDTLTVDGSSLGAGDTLFFDGAASSGRLILTGGAGDDVLLGGAENDSFTGGLGGDRMNGGAGTNVYNYSSVAQSTSTGYDNIQEFNNAGSDRIHLPFIPSAVDTSVTTGTLSTATFDTDLASAIGAAQLHVGDAVVFTPDAGTLAGRTFLIVDANGTAGYQASQDYVIELGAHSLTSVSLFDFI
jgi:Ca2+-binding RTX toxin-like protein